MVIFTTSSSGNCNICSVFKFIGVSICTVSIFHERTSYWYVVHISWTFSITVRGTVKTASKAIIKVDEKCRIWIHAVLLGFTAVMICIQFVILKCYTFRKRDETLSNDQMFAVDYFNKYLSHRSSATRDYH